MRRSAQSRLALAGAFVSGAAALACVLLLLANHLQARRTGPLEQQRVLELQSRVQQDASFAEPLAEEHRRQTLRQQQRRSSRDRTSAVLIIASALFLLFAKWSQSLRPPRVPALSRLVELRRPPPPARRSQRSPPPQAASARPPDEPDVTAVDEIVARIGRLPQDAIPLLQALQARFGYLPPVALRRICATTEVTAAQIAGVASFYERFRRTPPGRHSVRVCVGTACHVAGARQIADEIRRRFEIPPSVDTDPQRRVTLEPVACLGCCSLAPVMTVDGHSHGRLTPATCVAELEAVVGEPAT